MLPTLTRSWRFAFVLGTSAIYAGWHGTQHAAYAKGDDDSADDDDSGDDDSGKGDKGGGDEDSDSDDGDNADDAKNQPPVTAGGLFTIKTYPQSEIARPLTITKGITQLRLGLGTDLSSKGAFSTAGVSLEAEYGVADNFMLVGGLTDAYNFRQYSAYLGFEAALAYDLVDIRLAANLHRNALAEYKNYCDPPSPTDNPDSGMCSDSATLDNLPDGNYHSGGTQFSIDLGFPFRYAIKPQIAIIALQTLISFDFLNVGRDHTHGVDVSVDDPMNPGSTITVNRQVPTSNSQKPDLNPSLGIAINPIPALSVVIYGQLRIPDFDVSAGAFQVPITARVEFSPTRTLDVGLEFTLSNVNAVAPQGAVDNRFLNLFAQARFGK